MNQIFPESIDRALESGAKRFGRALRDLGWPNGFNKDAPPSEINATINFMYHLRDEGDWRLYAESKISDRGRVDLVGFDGQVAFALEAKAFGDINKKSMELLNDLQRLSIYTPSMAELAGDEQAFDWWMEAKSRWAIILASAFCGDRIKHAWLAENDDSVCRALAVDRNRYPKRNGNGSVPGFLQLHAQVRHMHRGSALITDGTHWKDTGAGWLLWAARPL